MTEALKMLVKLVVLIAPFALCALGVTMVLTQASQRRFLSERRGVEVPGVCVNLRWDTVGNVASIVRYEGPDGVARTVRTDFASSIRIPVGKSTRVLCDPLGKNPPMVAGSKPLRGYYVIGGALAVVGAVGFSLLLRLLF